MRFLNLQRRKKNMDVHWRIHYSSWSVQISSLSGFCQWLVTYTGKFILLCDNTIFKRKHGFKNTRCSFSCSNSISQAEGMEDKERSNLSSITTNIFFYFLQNLLVPFRSGSTTCFWRPHTCSFICLTWHLSHKKVQRTDIKNFIFCQKRGSKRVQEKLSQISIKWISSKISTLDQQPLAAWEHLISNRKVYIYLNVVSLNKTS